VVLCVIKDPEHRVGLRSVKRKRLSASQCTVHPERNRMSRICITKFASGNVGQKVACRYKHRQTGLFQNVGNAPVQFLKESRRFGRAGAQILHERSLDRCNERRAHAMSHHVANNHSRDTVGDLKDLEKIAADR
jgi:hypothetical protein